MAQVLQDAQLAASARAELAAKREAEELETIKSEARREFEQHVKPLLEKAAERKRAKAQRAAARKAARAAGDTTRAKQVARHASSHQSMHMHVRSSICRADWPGALLEFRFWPFG